MKGNELKGALLKRFAGEMEVANGNNHNNLATTSLIRSDDVPEMQPTKVIKFFTLDQIPVKVRLELEPHLESINVSLGGTIVNVLLCVLVTVVKRFLR